MIQSIKIGDLEYISNDALTFGDYGGFGSAGLANIEVMIEDHKESIVCTNMQRLSDAAQSHLANYEQELINEITSTKPEVIETHGDYSSRQVWIRKDVDKVEGYTDRLENYPCLDEEKMSEIELDWEVEAWNDWLKSDLIRSLPDEIEELIDDMNDDKLFSLYRQAMEECNEYPTAEYSGVYVDVNRISETFGKLIVEAVDGSKE
jgi:hypothetical protein